MTQYESRTLTRYWLILGIASLALAGLYAIVLVVARTPQLAAFAGIFHEALVVHVDLSVLVWFLCIACLFWSQLAAEKGQEILKIPYLEEAALLCFAAGIISMVLSPLDGSAGALMSNYIPVITSPLFFVSLCLIFCGVAFSLLHLALAGAKSGAGLLSAPLLQFAVITAALITLISMASFAWSFLRMPAGFDGAQYYELIFWAGGHVLQFTHTQIMMLCWLLLAVALRPSFGLPQVVLRCLFLIAPLAVLVTPWAFLHYDITSMEFREFFTHQMIVAGAVAPLLLCVPLLWVFARKNTWQPESRALWACLITSIALFVYGGVLGGLIRGQNVVIPAHYHGSIVGVTLAFMGAAYLFLPRLGYAPIAHTRLAFWQPIIYAGGQALHITGLAISGGYGALRKTPGAASLSPEAQAALGMMGLGGLLAIIGGLMFVIAMWFALRKSNHAAIVS